VDFTALVFTEGTVTQSLWTYPVPNFMKIGETVVFTPLCIVFTAPLFTKLTGSQPYYLHLSCTSFYTISQKISKVCAEIC
jgi:hypothetical protein